MILPQTYLDLFTLFLFVLPIPIPQNAPKPLWDSMKRVALQLELVSSTEHWATSYATEMDYCRRFYKELNQAPNIQESSRFRNAQEVVWFYRNRMEYLKNRRGTTLHQYDQITEAMEDTSRALVLWEKMETAQREDISWTYRRRTLQDIKQILGPARFYSGDMPMP